ncbi:MAG: hypothetical protein E6I80_06515 [Chloroflexi bacterium]|nr:MAG: hypothetical protein E6I80_06515 [Chloroflexota bacterium]
MMNQTCSLPNVSRRSPFVTRAGLTPARRVTAGSDDARNVRTSPGPHRLGRGGTQWARPQSCSALRAFRPGTLALAPVRHRPRLTRLLSQRPTSENCPSISRSSGPINLT